MARATFPGTPAPHAGDISQGASTSTARPWATGYMEEPEWHEVGGQWHVTLAGMSP